MANWQMFITIGLNLCTLTLNVCFLYGRGICLQSSQLGKQLNLSKYLLDDTGLDFKTVSSCRHTPKRQTWH